MAVTTQSFRTALGGLALAASIMALGQAPAWAAGDVATGSVSGLPIPRFVSLKSDRVNARSGPNKDQEVRWVYTHVGMPVEVTAEFENWRRIRDWEGAEGWVYHSLLSGKRMAVVVPKTKDELVPLYENAGIESAVVGPVAIRRARDAQILQWQLVPVQRQRLRRLYPARTAVGRLSEREGGVGPKAAPPNPPIKKAGTGPAIATTIVFITGAQRFRRSRTTTSTRAISKPSGAVGVLPTMTSASGISSTSSSPSTKK